MNNNANIPTPAISIVTIRPHDVAQCASCGLPIPSGSHYCRECGQPICAECSPENGHRAFCDDCRRELSDSLVTEQLAATFGNDD